MGNRLRVRERAASSIAGLEVCRSKRGPALVASKETGDTVLNLAAEMVHASFPRLLKAFKGF